MDGAGGNVVNTSIRAGPKANKVDGVRPKARVHSGGETESFILSIKDAEITNVFRVAHLRIGLLKHREPFGIVGKTVVYQS